MPGMLAACKGLGFTACNQTLSGTDSSKTLPAEDKLSNTPIRSYTKNYRFIVPTLFVLTATRSSADKGSPVTGSDSLSCNSQNSNQLLPETPSILNNNPAPMAKTQAVRNIPRGASGSTASQTASQIFVTPPGLQVSHLRLKQKRSRRIKRVTNNSRHLRKKQADGTRSWSARGCELSKP